MDGLDVLKEISETLIALLGTQQRISSQLEYNAHLLREVTHEMVAIARHITHPAMHPAYLPRTATGRIPSADPWGAYPASIAEKYPDYVAYADFASMSRLRPEDKKLLDELVAKVDPIERL